MFNSGECIFYDCSVESPKGRRSVNKIFIVFVASLLAFGCAHSPSATQKARVEDILHAPVSTACAKDADCVKIQDDCCGCRAGGKARAIHRGYAQSFLLPLTKSCEGVSCTGVMSSDSTCSAKPVCQKGACALRIMDLPAGTNWWDSKNYKAEDWAGQP